MRIDKRSNKTIASYKVRLKEKAKYCGFGDSTNERILKHMIQIIDDDGLLTS